MIEKIENIVKQICAECSIGLYDVEIKSTTKGKVLCVYLTKMGGVTIDDCSLVSKKISQLLDEENLFDSNYYLEVSSPGIERNLKYKKHYVSAINEMIVVTYVEDEKKITEKGILREVLPETIHLEIEGDLKIIAFHDIRKAKTYYEMKVKETA